MMWRLSWGRFQHYQLGSLVAGSRLSLTRFAFFLCHSSLNLVDGSAQVAAHGWSVVFDIVTSSPLKSMGAREYVTCVVTARDQSPYSRVHVVICLVHVCGLSFFPLYFDSMPSS